jgi:hypothetical protein
VGWDAADVDDAAPLVLLLQSLQPLPGENLADFLLPSPPLALVPLLPPLAAITVHLLLLACRRGVRVFTAALASIFSGLCGIAVVIGVLPPLPLLLHLTTLIIVAALRQQRKVDAAVSAVL